MARIGLFVGSGLVAIAFLTLTPSVVFAQSGFAGTVKDSTGAVLPGVTIEASSPTLIERTRSTVTNEQGQYKILDLRPGIYSVTFTLPGFAIFKREEIELPANFTAPVKFAGNSISSSLKMANPGRVKVTEGRK